MRYLGGLELLADALDSFHLANRCAYCGGPSRGQLATTVPLTCPGHRDLPPIDPHYSRAARKRVGAGSNPPRTACEIPLTSGGHTMRQTEYPHSTPEQVREYLAEAVKIVAELELDERLEGVAFAKAIDLLAAKQIFFEQATMGLPRGRIIQ